MSSEVKVPTMDTTETKDSGKGVAVKAAKAAATGTTTDQAKESETKSSESGEKTLSNKELKEQKKREKAEKRAQEKKNKGISFEQQEQLAKQKMEKKKLLASATHIKKQLNLSLVKENTAKVPALFRHLETREQRNASSPLIYHLIHPAVLDLAIRYSVYATVGSSTRLRHMLRVFKVVIKDYKTPENSTLTRHLTSHLSNQINYLKTARPLSISMGNAIRWLKQEISHISIDTTEALAKERLCQRIDDFINERIELADMVIVENASKHITQNSVILTFGHSEVLERLFKYCATEQNKLFTLIVVDSRPLFEGKKLISKLTECTTDQNGMAIPITKSHIQVQYSLINAVSSSLLEDVDFVLVGAHAMLSNGRLYSRIGTGLIAMMAHTRNIPVLTCCESIKFSDRVQLDSVTTNELADPEDLLLNIASKRAPQKLAYATEQFIKSIKDKVKTEEKGKGKGQRQASPAPKESPDILTELKSLPNLSVLNIMYDLTPPEYINKVITEVGALPPSSVPVILREYKNIV